MSSKIVQQARDALRAAADRNHDGKVTRQDLETVLGPLEEKAKAETVKHPMGALLTVAAFASVIGFVIARSLPC
jgi:Ca2+-binding EF-hand superfamily protein